MRLIDAEWLEDLLLMHEQNARAIEASGRKVSFTYADGIRTGYADVGLCPTIEAEPIKHGQWINVNDGKWNTVYVLKCSCCGEIDTRMYVTDNYCPNCGAKMDAQIGEDKSHPFAESVMMGMDEVEE